MSSQACLRGNGVTSALWESDLRFFLRADSLKDQSLDTIQAPTPFFRLNDCMLPMMLLSIRTICRAGTRPLSLSALRAGASRFRNRGGGPNFATDRPSKSICNRREYDSIVFPLMDLK